MQVGRYVKSTTNTESPYKQIHHTHATYMPLLAFLLPLTSSRRFKWARWPTVSKAEGASTPGGSSRRSTYL